MELKITHATDDSFNLLVALYGVSGSGKTYSALTLASGVVDRIGGSILVIDTENKSAKKYGAEFDFDHIDIDASGLDNKKLIEILKQVENDYSVVIIDSLSHFWTALTDEVTLMSSAKFNNNGFLAWAKEPRQRELIYALTHRKNNIIATMRSKTTYQTSDNNGKKKVEKMGLEPIQGKEIEYDFDYLIRINADTSAVVEKSRSRVLPKDTVVSLLTREHGQQLGDWVNKTTPKEAPVERPKTKPKAKQEVVEAQEEEVDTDVVQQIVDKIRSLTKEKGFAALPKEYKQKIRDRFEYARDSRDTDDLLIIFEELKNFIET